MSEHSFAGFLAGLRVSRVRTPRTRGLVDRAVAGQRAAFSEDVFQSMLTFERRRAERSRKPFILMLLGANEKGAASRKILEQVVTVLTTSVRDSDMVGWYKDQSVVGVIFTEIDDIQKNLIAEAILAKISGALEASLNARTADKLVISMHVFPEDWDPENPDWIADSKLYPELRSNTLLERISTGVKRAIDIAGSATLLALLSPVLLAIALGIKLGSKGPVLFRQQRLGQFGARFVCLKFRSMSSAGDQQIHRQFVHQFISGKDQAESTPAAPAVYKITNDPRVTAVGRILRKTSLDELPQLWNVLVGEMSLVGPRPPIPYEFEMYQLWHRRRVLELKPGLTGLWQVSGRSRTRFDEMVRLDLSYSRNWSLWLDLKILAATPMAVISGDGAH